MAELQIEGYSEAVQVARGGFGVVWVASDLDLTVTRIDPATNEATSVISVGDTIGSLAADDGGAWVANSADGTVTRIDVGSA